MRPHDEEIIYVSEPTGCFQPGTLYDLLFEAVHVDLGYVELFNPAVLFALICSSGLHL